MKNIQDNFSVHFQCYKNELAVENAILKFRSFYPNVNMRLVSDNGSDFSNMCLMNSVDFKFENLNILPRGKLTGIESTIEFFRRIYDTCVLYSNSEWILLFEDDVLTKSPIREFPTTDCAGLCSHPLSYELGEYINNINSSCKTVYGMCGGSMFRRKSFMKCFESIDKNQFMYMNTLDNRLLQWTDIPITVLFLINGFQYSEWSCLDQPTSGIKRQFSAFEHNYKELYA